MSSKNSSLLQVSQEIDVDELIEKRKLNPNEPEITNTTTSVNSDVAPASNSKKVVDLDRQPTKDWDDDMPLGPGHHSADPFAPREGKTLVWKNVNMTLVRFFF